MRIAFGFDIFYPETNGVITSTLNLANNLILRGHKVYFFVPYHKSLQHLETIGNGIKLVKIKGMPSYIYKGMRNIPVSGWYMYPYLLRYKIDIIHNTSPWLMGMSLNHAARRLHIPSIATHHTLIDNPIYIKYALKSDALSYAAQDAIWTVVFAPFYNLTWMATAPNKATCRQVQERFPGLDVRYVSNGIDISKFDENNPIKPLPKQIDESWLGDKTFLYVGRLGYEKAIDVAFDAFQLLLERVPDAKFIIIGRGPAEEMLKRQIKKLSIENNVLMTGLIPNDEIIGSRLFSKVAAFVTASLSENQAITVIESLCSGCPIICADVENMHNLVDESQGWFFEGGSAEDLSNKMEYVLTHREERDKKALATKKSLPLFDGKNVAAQFERIYLDLLAMKRSGFYVKKGREKAEKYLYNPKKKGYKERAQRKLDRKLKREEKNSKKAKGEN